MPRGVGDRARPPAGRRLRSRVRAASIDVRMTPHATPEPKPAPPSLAAGSEPAPGPARIDAEQVRPILPQLIDSLTDAVVVVDRSRRVVAANRRYLEAFGGRTGTLVGEFCLDVLGCPARDSDEAGCAGSDTREACAACAA